MYICISFIQINIKLIEFLRLWVHWHWQASKNPLNIIGGSNGFSVFGSKVIWWLWPQSVLANQFWALSSSSIGSCVWQPQPIGGRMRRLGSLPTDWALEAPEGCRGWELLIISSSSSGWAVNGHHLTVNTRMIKEHKERSVCRLCQGHQWRAH